MSLTTSRTLRASSTTSTRTPSRREPSLSHITGVVMPHPLDVLLKGDSIRAGTRRLINIAHAADTRNLFNIAHKVFYARRRSPGATVGPTSRVRTRSRGD